MEGECKQVQAVCTEQTLESNQLVLGIDDFAIRKGHTYNTGLHDLRGDTFLDVIPGRKLEDLRAYYQEHPHWMNLQPVAVVMDLAKAYHDCPPKNPCFKIEQEFSGGAFTINGIDWRVQS
nr:transposase [Sporosarcina limicola]